MRQKILLCLMGTLIFLFAGCAQQPEQNGAEGSAGVAGSQTGQSEPAGPQGPDKPDPVFPGQAAGSAAPAASGASPQTYIVEDEAKRSALAHAGLEEDQVTFVSSVLECDDGQWEYDVEFYTADYAEYDYEIDAFTGAVISFDYDAEHHVPQPEGSSAITLEQARQLALDQVPGAAEGDIRELKLDSDDGILLYEGEIVYNNTEYEFEIDAYSGAIREWSAEPHYSNHQK